MKLKTIKALSKIAIGSIALLPFTLINADGNVSVSIQQDDDIIVVGDSADNQIRIIGGGGALLTIIGLDGTTINGGSDFHAYMNSDLIIDTKIGLDEIELKDISARTYKLKCYTWFISDPEKCGTRPPRKSIIISGGMNGVSNFGIDTLKITDVETDDVILSNLEFINVDESRFRLVKISDSIGSSFTNFSNTIVGETVNDGGITTAEGGFFFTGGTAGDNLNFQNGIYRNVNIDTGRGGDHISMNATGSTDSGSYWRDYDYSLTFANGFNASLGGHQSGDDRFSASVSINGGYILVEGGATINGGTGTRVNRQQVDDVDIACLQQFDQTQNQLTDRIWFNPGDFEKFYAVADVHNGSCPPGFF